MVMQHYRWDFIGLSTYDKPTPEVSPKVVDGSTYYEADTSKLFVFCKGTWYEKTATGGGGGGGSVNSVNNVSPDSNGNVTLTPSDIGAQPALTAGSNITIEDGTISATDTTYSNFTGTDGTAAGTAGLVPAPATTDAGKFLKADGTWDSAGSSVNVVQTTGTSTTDVMSQNAVTEMVFADPSVKRHVLIGSGQSDSSNYGIAILGNSSGYNGAIAIGNSSRASVIGYGGGSSGVALGASAIGGDFAVGVGANATATGAYSVAFGSYSRAFSQGQFDISTGARTTSGYNSSNYRLLSGVYDGQSDHDAATVGQLKLGTLSTTPTGTTVGFPGRLYTLDTGGGVYEVYLCVHDNGDDTYVWKQVSLI